MAKHVRKWASLISIAKMICVILLFSAFTIESNWMFTYGISSDVTFPPASWPNGMLKYETIDTRIEGLELEGRIPSLTPNAGPLTYRINNVIDQAIEDKIQEAREMRSRLLTFAYETYFADPYMSIILKSTAASASSKTEVISINFNTETGELISAADVVGSHVVQLADRLLVEMIRRNPERFNPSFTGMRNDQAFSITDTEITFWFNEFQLAPGFEGIVPLTLRLDDIKEVVLTKDAYRIREGFNLKMVPVNIVRQLGYDFTWQMDGSTSSVIIYHNDELVIEIFIGVNNYVREQRFTRSLEAAPEIIGGRTYVPISFFDQILSLVSFSIDDQDTITFASYPVTDEWFDR